MTHEPCRVSEFGERKRWAPMWWDFGMREADAVGRLYAVARKCYITFGHPSNRAQKRKFSGVTMSVFMEQRSLRLHVSTPTSRGVIP